MISKGEKTKKFIIDRSIKLFSEKGYTSVTMKDVCEKCEMSRGGVYRYFSSTKEIFIEMLNLDIEVNRKIVEESIKKGISAEKILDGYFNQEMNSIFNENNGLYFAIHEFAFQEEDQKENLNKRLRDSIEIIGEILSYGQKNKEFKPFDTEVVATHLIYFMDSLKTSSSIFKLSKDMIIKQINLLKEIVI